jgi:predicted PurR-regulated permease PerM
MTKSFSNRVLVILLVLAALYTIYFARAFLLPVVLAMLFSLILSPTVRALKQLHIPEPLGATVVVATLVAGLVSAMVSLSEPAVQWVSKAPKILLEIEYKLHGVKKSVDQVAKVAEKVEAMTAPASSAKPQAKVTPAKPSLLSRTFAGTQRFLLSMVSTLILLYFLLASGDTFLRKMVRAMPTLTDKKRAVGVARTIQSEMARYLFAITCINAGLGVATGLAMHWLGMPNPILWGVMVAVLNYVPYVGATTSLAILSLVAFLSFEQTSQVLLVSAVFFAIVTIEGQLLTPWIVGARLTLHPVLIFVGMLFWGWLWGVAGALIAVPILMTFKIFCDHFEKMHPVSEFMSRRVEFPEG